MLPMMSSAVLRSSLLKRVLIQLPDEMLLERFLGGDGIEEELALFLVLLRAAAVAARLRHVIAPLVIELGQLIEFLLEIIFRRLALGNLALLFRRLGQFLEHGVGLHLLLHEVAQFEEGRLENEQALLELRREDLLQGKILRLKHSRAGHGQKGINWAPSRKQFSRRANGRSASRTRRRDRNVTCSLIWSTSLLMKKLTLLGGARSSGHLHRRAIARVARSKGQLEAMFKEVQAQQIQIAENQAKIDAKLATLAEAIRVARIYSSRGGR